MSVHAASPSSAIWPSLSFALMLAMTATWALSAIGFLFGVSIGRWQSVCGVLLGACLVLRGHGAGRARWLSLAYLTALLAGSLFISAATVDYSFDGWAYHQPAVIALSHGWNPLSTPTVGSWWAPFGRSIGYPSNEPPIDILWTTVYPKALWILGANALVWGLPLDAGKYPGLLLMLVSGLTALRALQLRGMPAAWAYALSALAALNPVCIVQATTFYVDGSLGSCLAILIFSLLSYDITRRGRDLVLALCAAVLACNLKFTGPVYAAQIVLPITVWWLLQRRLVARDLLLCGIAALVLVAASINPYFTNLRAFGSPVYPLNEWDVMEDQMSRGFLEEPGIEKLLKSLTFSNLVDPFSGNLATDDSNFTSPLQSRELAEFRRFGAMADLRFGGFGPFFAITLALTMLAVGVLIRNSSLGLGFSILAISTLLTVLVNPQMWWARLVPQMWLLPVLVASTASRTQIARALAATVVLLLGVTSLIATIGRTTSSVAATRIYGQQLRRLGGAPLLVHASVSERYFFPTLTYRLHEQGQSFQVTTGPCAPLIDLLVIQGCTSGSRER